MITFEEILEDVKVDKQFTTDMYDDTIISYIGRGLLDLTLVGVAVSKAVVLPVTMIKTVDLPADFVSWVKVGRICGEEVIGLTQTEALIKHLNLDPCGHEYRELVSCCDKDNNLYRKKWGSFKLDMNNHRLILDAKFDADKVYLEYVSKGYSDFNGQTMIPYYAKLALISYVHLQFSKNMPLYRQEYQIREREYTFEKTRAIRQKYPLSMADINRIIAKNRKLIRTVY
jgi:hypothetical protein